jgi:hypothetical protein
MVSTFSGDETAPFFGFLGAAAALVFSCEHHRHYDQLSNQIKSS